jgi:quercetin dioxygenase-like cupin family protein
MNRFLIGIVFILPAMFLTACIQASAPAVNATPAPDAVTADPAHYTVLFENDLARLLRIRYPGGATSVMHNHPAGCGIFLVGQTFKFTPPQGEPLTVENHAGDVTCGDAEDHLPQNAGTADAELILLELKNRKTFDNIQTGRSITISSKADVPDAISSDPRHYSVQFENDAVRLLRVKIAPGEGVPMHAHPANCTVELTTWTAGGGGAQPTEVKAGQVDCVDAEAHAGANVGKTPAEMIVVEFKGRDSFKS